LTPAVIESSSRSLCYIDRIWIVSEMTDQKRRR
jgi:hypothetical protein